jgi:hypothetical protein
MTNSGCKCGHIVQTGFWDGKDGNGCAIGGPQVKCQDCEAEFSLTWEKWNQIPNENKKALI